jgi:glycine betaine/proline transport system permease protein
LLKDHRDAAKPQCPKRLGVGADGLGVPVVRALNQVNTALGFEAGFVIVVVAILLDRMLRVTRK